MDINLIIGNTTKPELYKKGTAEMWTDEYISRQLLDIHLNPDIDLASRRISTIENTVSWILSKVACRQLNILDLGCGPGLYAELLTKAGHKVTGIDYSKNSIEYARKSAQNKHLDIDYINENYLDIELEKNKFDLVILIYTDLGVLLPGERERLLNSISMVLKPGGVFIFDVMNDKNIENKTTPKNWEALVKGFWKDKPYLALSDSFHYKRHKVILYQHIIIDEENNIDIYRFWTHHFSHSDLTEILTKHSFYDISFYEDVLPEGDLWSGKNVTFCKAVKRE